jgi:biopolymer transport protein TolR
MARSARKRRLMGEINVVPYIDVMLVLLIIFMVTAPLLIQGVDVNLPEVDAEPVDPETLQDKEPVTLTVDAEGRMYLTVGDIRDREVDAGEVVELIGDRLRERPDTPVYVRGDGGARYSRVVEALTLVQAAGASGVGLITQPPERRAGEE